MARLRVKNLQENSDLLADLNICSDDSRLFNWINAFEQQALVYGRWWGTTQLMQFCLTDSGCLVLPRGIAVIESANLGTNHVAMRGGWYDFIKPHEPCGGTCCARNCNCGCSAASIVDKGMVASFRVTTGTNKKIRVYPGNSADVGKKIIFQGKDANGNYVRRSIGGSIQEGEEVTLALPFVDTVTVWGPGAPYAVMKEVTQYPVLVYSIDQDDGVTEVQLASYQPSETEPSYRRIQIPGYCSPSENSQCQSRSLLVVASLDQVPVRTANDWLLFHNMEAYRQGLMSVKLRKDGNQALADAYFFGSPRQPKNSRGVLRYAEGMGALPILRAELRKMTGDVTAINIQHDGLNLAGFR